MNAGPLLEQAMKALNKVGLEAIIIGNSGAAINGAPVTTMDIDFYIRDISKSLAKLKQVAGILNCRLVPPQSDVSNVFRIENAERGIFLDFIDKPIGMKSFESIRSRSIELKLKNNRIYVASLDDIIKSKKAANRAKDLAVIRILEITHYEKNKSKK